MERVDTMLTADGYFLSVAGGHVVYVWQEAQQFPCFPEELEDIAWVKLLLGERHMPKEWAWGQQNMEYSGIVKYKKYKQYYVTSYLFFNTINYILLIIYSSY